MAEKYILAIDEGTTGTRALIVDRHSNIKAQAYSEFTQYTPTPDRTEHDAEEIWDATYAMMKKVLADAGLKPTDIAAIGITNQRSTRLAWDRATGKPIHRALVWQDMRNAAFVEANRPQWGEKCYKHTGWPFSPLYSSIGLWWLMENVPGARARAEKRDVIFGNVDAWLVYKLTGGKVHATSASNATVAGYYDLYKNEWYKEWLDYLGVPVVAFPEVRDDNGNYGVTDPALFGAEIPITGNIGDQQAGLFGQGCMKPGEVKCTHGTGTFLNMNVGDKLPDSRSGTNVLIAWRINGQNTYTLEGYASVTGSAVQWLRDGAELIKASKESEALATSVPDNGGVYFVPAMTGFSCAILGFLGPRHDHRHYSRHVARAPGARDAGVDRLPDQGFPAEHAPGFRYGHQDHEGRWRCGAQRLPHAVPGRPAGCRSCPSRQPRSNCHGCSLHGRVGLRPLEEHRRDLCRASRRSRIQTANGDFRTRTALCRLDQSLSSARWVG